MDIRFKSERTKEEVVRQVAAWLYEWFDLDYKSRHPNWTPRADRQEALEVYWDEERRKYEITSANDYKLYVESDGRYGYLDRYHPPERIAFLVEKLEGWEGASDVQRRIVGRALDDSGRIS